MRELEFNFKKIVTNITNDKTLFIDEVDIDYLVNENYLCYIDLFTFGVFFVHDSNLYNLSFFYDEFKTHKDAQFEFQCHIYKKTKKIYNRDRYICSNIEPNEDILMIKNSFLKKFLNLKEIKFKVLLNSDFSKTINDFYFSKRALLQ